MLCPRCGGPNKQDAVVCGHCGLSIVPNCVHHRGDVLVFPTDSELPPACVHCGRAMDLPENYTTLSWIPPWAYALLLFGVVGIIAVAISRRKISIRVPICDLHSERYRYLRMASIFLIVFSIGLVVLAVGDILPDAFTGPTVLLAIADFVGGLVLFGIKPLRATYICRSHAWLKGADKQFLALLPEMINPAVAMRSESGAYASANAQPPA